MGCQALLLEQGGLEPGSRILRAEMLGPGALSGHMLWWGHASPAAPPPDLNWTEGFLPAASRPIRHSAASPGLLGGWAVLWLEGHTRVSCQRCSWMVRASIWRSVNEQLHHLDQEGLLHILGLCSLQSLDGLILAPLAGLSGKPAYFSNYPAARNDLTRRSGPDA